jgi:hypothetical protein
MKSTLKTVAPIYVVAILLIALTEIGWLRLPEPFGRLTIELGIALLAIASIHILDHKTLIKDVAERIARQSQDAFTSTLRDATNEMTGNVKGSIDSATTTIVDNVTTKTKTAIDDASQVLQRQVASIRVMETCNLVAIYPSRDAAAATIRQAISSSQDVWLMGISLNEFYRQEYGAFRDAWDELVKGIRDGRKKARVLLIDPYSHGAVLRSYAETHGSAGVQDRLEGDVRGAAKLLHEIRGELGKKASDLDVRVYRLAPTAFICRTDAFTFTQQYYFWRKRLPGCPIPVFEYRKRGKGHDGVCIHCELEQHFEFIWKHGSIPLDTISLSDPSVCPVHHFWPRPSRGLDWGAHASGMEAVFVDRDRPAFRMQEEISRSKHVCIQGITLKAFFDDSALAKLLERRVPSRKDCVDSKQSEDSQHGVRVLVLDPDCEQATVRAYREFQLNTPGGTCSLDEFRNKHYHQSRLWTDLQATIGKLKQMKGIHSRKYDTAPHLFVLIGDDAAFVEQYTYGKLMRASPTEEEVILGSDMPLIEYSNVIDPVYAKILKQVRSEENEYTERLRPQPYPLLVNHFEYAWTQARDI